MSENRYFGSSGEDQVFNITAKEIKLSRKENIKNQKRKQKFKGLRKKGSADPYPGRAPVNPNKVKKYERGESGFKKGKVKTKFGKKMESRREERIKEVAETAARAEEMLAREDAGALQGDKEEEFTARITQTQIKKVL